MWGKVAWERTQPFVTQNYQLHRATVAATAWEAGLLMLEQTWQCPKKADGLYGALPQWPLQPVAAERHFPVHLGHRESRRAAGAKCAPLFFTGATLLPPQRNPRAGRRQAKPCRGGSFCTLHCAMKSCLWGRNAGCPLSVKGMCSALLWWSMETPSFKVLFALCIRDQHSLNTVQVLYSGQDLPLGFFFPLAAKYPEYGTVYLHCLDSSWCWSKFTDTPQTMLSQF